MNVVFLCGSFCAYIYSAREIQPKLCVEYILYFPVYPLIVISGGKSMYSVYICTYFEYIIFKFHI